MIKTTHPRIEPFITKCFGGVERIVRFETMKDELEGGAKELQLKIFDSNFDEYWRQHPMCDVMFFEMTIDEIKEKYGHTLTEAELKKIKKL